MRSRSSSNAVASGTAVPMRSPPALLVRYRVVLTGKATRDRVPVFEFCFGERKTKRAAENLAVKVHAAHPKGIVRIDERIEEKPS